MAAGGPAGWPRDLPPPGSSEFAAKVGGWLLDRGPADLRLSPLRNYPVALVRVIACMIDGEIDGARRAYANARVDLSAHLTPAEVLAVQAALEAEGARLLTVKREVALVEESLRGLD